MIGNDVRGGGCVCAFLSSAALFVLFVTVSLTVCGNNDDDDDECRGGLEVEEVGGATSFSSSLYSCFPGLSRGE